MTPVRVKVCGITNPADALAAVSMGADALGFVFFPKSPRYVSPECARAIIQQLPPFVARVGVFVNASIEAVEKTVWDVGLSAVQLSGDEPVDFLRNAPFSVIRAVRVRDRESLEAMRAYPPGTAIVLDSFHRDFFGGTGTTFDWSLGHVDSEIYRVIIAGGLTPQNVKSAVDRFRPFGVDVASGVEERPGIKDYDKMRRFIEIVRNL